MMIRSSTHRLSPLARISPCCPLHFQFHFHRQAHAAAIPRSDDSVGGSGSSSSYTQQGTSRKGKEKQGTLAQTYRFPERGRLGGPPDPFEVMALERTACEQDVKQQYYKLALLLHPDSSHPSSSPEHFATLNRAYKLLSRPSSRSSFLKTGYGWDIGHSSGPFQDNLMRAEVFKRRAGGAAAWETKSRRSRDSEAGRGAWGGFNGEQGWKPYENVEFGFHTTHSGTGEQRYMSNPRFLAVVGIIGAAMAWLQYHRVGQATESSREVLDRQHSGASHALAQARYEAAIHGKTRREQIRRRVREAEVLKELERIEQGEVAPHGSI